MQVEAEVPSRTPFEVAITETVREETVDETSLVAAQNAPLDQGLIQQVVVVERRQVRARLHEVPGQRIEERVGEFRLMQMKLLRGVIHEAARRCRKAAPFGSQPVIRPVAQAIKQFAGRQRELQVGQLRLAARHGHLCRQTAPDERLFLRRQQGRVVPNRVYRRVQRERRRIERHTQSISEQQ